jgi:hypothetical protein
MSIVSAKLGMVNVSVKKQPGNAVQLGFDSVPDFATAAQLPTFNKFRQVRSPAGPSVKPNGTKVPVKFKQEGQDYSREDTEVFQTTLLKPAVQRTSNMDFSMLLNENAMTTNPPFPYNMGIKPASRFLKIDEVQEPAGDFFRP